jgi:hypothetical protein
VKRTRLLPRPERVDGLLPFPLALEIVLGKIGIADKELADITLWESLLGIGIDTAVLPSTADDDDDDGEVVVANVSSVIALIALVDLVAPFRESFAVI